MSSKRNILTDAQREEISADLHIFVSSRLGEITEEEPRLEDIGHVMASAFGDICGLLAISGLGVKIPELNARAEQSAQSIMRSLAEATCEGSA